MTSQVTVRPMSPERAPNGIVGWHFLADSGVLANTDPPIRVEAGMTYSVTGRIVCCEHGLHGGESALDALQYAPGSRVCRTYHHGTIRRDTTGDKLASRHRDVLWIADATRTLHQFAIWCARQALALVPEPDPRSIAALAVKERWLDGGARDEELDAAWDAARAAARAAAWEAAGAAAREAARAAARAAAWEAAGAAAREAARAAQRAQLETMLLALAPQEGAS